MHNRMDEREDKMAADQMHRDDFFGADFSASGMHRTPEVLCIGQAVVDCITRNIQDSPDGTARKTADSITLNVGGDAVNESVALSRMGHSAGLLCCVGDDLAGRIVLEEARRHGVSTDAVTIMRELETPVADIIVQADGSRSSVSSSAARLPGFEPDLKKALQTYGSVRVISFASLFRAPLDDAAVIRRLIRQAHESGAIVCADTKLPTFRKTALAELADVLPMVDYFFPNEEEAAYYTGEQDPLGAARKLLSLGIRAVVIKRGAEGICAGYCSGAGSGSPDAGGAGVRTGSPDAGGAEFFSLPAVPVNAVDTTGAGDHFAAGFICALLQKKDFRECCGMGLEAAAHCIVHAGGTE